MSAAPENKGWVPLTRSVIPDRFNSEYTGPFAQNLVAHQPSLKRFLDIASLDGRFLVTDQPPMKSSPTPNINSDGSMTLQSPMNLRLGQAKHVSPVSVLQPDPLGWRLSIDADEIMHQLKDKQGGSVRGVEKKFAKAFDKHVAQGLELAVIRDKLTLAKDPYLVGKLIASTVLMYMYSDQIGDLLNPQKLSDPFVLGADLMVKGCLIGLFANRYSHNRNAFTEDFDRKNLQQFGTDYTPVRKYIDPYRETNKSRWELIAPGVELDRVAIASIYLGWRRATRQPFIRLAN